MIPVHKDVTVYLHSYMQYNSHFVSNRYGDRGNQGCQKALIKEHSEEYALPLCVIANCRRSDLSVAVFRLLPLGSAPWPGMAEREWCRGVYPEPAAWLLAVTSHGVLFSAFSLSLSK